MRRVVTIDGPAGAGKSTVARKLAERLGWRFLDTGAIYRAVTLAALEQGLPVSDGMALGRLTATLDLKQHQDGSMYLAARNITADIRRSDVTAAVSAVSAHPEVRTALVSFQRRAADSHDLVCEGRDMGTIIFPNALLKIFLDADVATRAERRHQEMSARPGAPSIMEIEAQIRTRDAFDSSRTTAPLLRTPDQVYVDTSRRPIVWVVDTIEQLIRARISEATSQRNPDFKPPSGGGAPPIGSARGHHD